MYNIYDIYDMFRPSWLPQAQPIPYLAASFQHSPVQVNPPPTFSPNIPSKHTISPFLQNLHSDIPGF